MAEITEQWRRAFEEGAEMLEMSPGLEPTSAFRESGNHAGLDWGTDALGNFVRWAVDHWGGNV